MTCTFFGHRDAPAAAEQILYKVIEDLIENEGANLFYVGNHGGFDGMAKRALKKAKARYPHIRYSVVLAYLPKKKDELLSEDYSDTIYPEGLEKVPPKYAIIERNKWMLGRSDCVITYVSHITGGAAKFKEMAEKAGKRVINIPNLV